MPRQQIEPNVTTISAFKGENMSSCYQLDATKNAVISHCLTRCESISLLDLSCRENNKRARKRKRERKRKR